MVEFPYLAAPGCQIDGVEQHEQALWVIAHSTTEVARCPACAGHSTSIHSYHVRVLKDLPVGESSVTLKLRTKRFRCRNPDCAHSTFVETIPAVLVKHARRTPRLTSALWHIGQVTGGQAGSRLARRLRMPVSRATVLRILRQQPTCEREPPIIIGVDDWAKRKGQRYGTIVVDLENHQVVDVLDDRDSETLARWLRQYPALQVVARDRSMQYAQGISDGAPQAIQIADRWHLLKNLSEVVERVLQELLPRLKQRTTIPPSISAPRDKFPRAKPDQVRQAATRAQRLREYTLIQYLHRPGFGERRIARVLGMSRGKVSRYIDAATFPERKAHYVPSNLDPYLAYLEQRVQEGCTNAEQLWREIREHGYPGGSSQVTKWMQNRRKKSQPLQGLHLGIWVLAIAGGEVLNLLLKTVFNRPRPSYANAFVQEINTSFPSGHAMVSVILYGMLAYFLVILVRSWKVRILLIFGAALIIVLIGISRLYLGVHYLSDVVAGFLAGGIWLATCITTMEVIRERKIQTELNEHT